ncbi:unnamed protein product [Rhizophagus irregularis]|uniref:Uncharacterized protein n=1 Tax=Rhizophagus irregularis TaxID=588596 RepID=A0A2I1H6E7_9GLOM|nr:hypothetical protein RhiirA4_498520 [Rhizophagus irregularis]PKY53298.1 hypothetical protein RhiirA4_498676 [Rhizophagus irregularis]PKY54439.1 hypothetical protein RhiirA4_426782 [Rhizophagus irregularis]PKY57977.1 hypothetical protein RhiirA4_429388 [Rhizophagus irregularis]CAB4415770.1 unnamed protein product [Rhizophagus irregularis]
MDINEVTFTAICRPVEGYAIPDVVVIVQSRMINLSCIINALQPVIVRCGVPKIKPVYSSLIFMKLKKKGVPNIDQLDCYNKEGDVVYLSPKGLQVVPKNQQELFEAIVCVLEALAVSMMIMILYIIGISGG